MTTIESQMMMVPAGQNPGGGTIRLSLLIDHIIQRTYHELNVLSELLPRKTDMERKIEIVQFASRTRQLFIRLLALVKWANSAGKVDKCAMISSFLDQQAMLFVETADNLARMARDTLLQARLPCFSIPCAIDVLTTGSYPRLPACIKEKIVPPDPITQNEKRQTLLKLNQIIEHRLVTAELPSHMRRPIIQNGRVKFQVVHEFEVTLTLMGDGPNIPWRLLDIEILVEDPETGDGISLVHSLQVNYIHELIQSRLLDNDKALHDLYNVLHSFCQSLQLEVLHSQAQRLIHHRLGEHIRVEEYIPGRSMILSYWREAMKKEKNQHIYKLSIHGDEKTPSKPLQISHSPTIQGSESTKVAQAIRSDHLSLEKLLVHSIQVRALSKLKELERELRLIVPGPCETRDLPTVLYVPVLYPCMESERLSIAVDIQKGNFLVSLCLKETNLTADIQESINSDKRDLRRLLSKLRLWIALQRCQKSIQHIHTSCLEHLPFTNLSGHPLEELGTNKLFIKLPKQANYYLVVEATETYKRCVDYKYYMLEVEQSCNEGASKEEIDSLPKLYVKAGHLVELEKFACTHGAGAKVHDVEAEDPNPLTRKRKLFKKDNSGPQQKKLRGSSYFVPALPHILSLCEDRLPYALLGRELEKNSIAYSDIEVDGEGIGLSLSILGTVPCENLRPDIADRLKSDLLSLKFRIQKKGTRPTWILEALFCNTPVQSINPKEMGPIHRVLFGYDMSGADAAEKAVQNLIDDWNSLANLYLVAVDFGELYNENQRFLMELEVKNYTYKRLILAYGPNKCYTATVSYKAIDKKDQGSGEKKYHIVLGTNGQTNVANCHLISVNHLEQLLNDTRSLNYLAQILIDTWSPMCSIGKLTLAPMLGLTHRQNQATAGFTWIPQSSTHIRIIFRETYCLEVHCRGNRMVAVRDGAYSMFDTSKVVEPLIPIPGLKAFLNLFVDESMNTGQSRRRSTTEDDHPPSPMGMDSMDGGYMGSSYHPQSGSPASRGLTFKSPLTPPTNSPMTPASPAGSKMASASGNFPLASPPSLGPSITPSPSNMMAPSPGNPNLHVPSPGSFIPAPSPSSLGIHMPSPATQFISPQGMLEGGGGSPFPSSSNLAMPSPGAKNWPPSPSVPGPSPRTYAVTSPPQGGPGSMMSPPSRKLPQRSWAASIPTLLTHDAFEKLLYPCKLPSKQSGNHPLSPLERFLSCVFLRRHIQRVVQSEDNLQQLSSGEAGVVLFKVEGLQYKVCLHPTHMQCLTLKVTPNPEYNSQWDSEELQILERFFETKAASSPYKANAITAFGRLLAAPVRVLKDFIQIMKLELVPNSNMKWKVQWCLTIPHGAPLCTEVGVAAVVLRDKILFVLQLSSIENPQDKDPETVVVPILFTKAGNETQLVDQHDPKSNMPPPSQTHSAIKDMLRKFHQFNPLPNDCSIFPAITDVLTNLDCTSSSIAT